MKSGLEGRNNLLVQQFGTDDAYVSMKSGLEGQNNAVALRISSFDIPLSQ